MTASTDFVLIASLLDPLAERLYARIGGLAAFAADPVDPADAKQPQLAVSTLRSYLEMLEGRRVAGVASREDLAGLADVYRELEALAAIGDAQLRTCLLGGLFEMLPVDGPVFASVWNHLGDHSRRLFRVALWSLSGVRKDRAGVETCPAAASTVDRCTSLDIVWEPDLSEVELLQENVATWNDTDFDWGLGGTVRLVDASSGRCLCALEETGPRWLGGSLLWILSRKLGTTPRAAELDHSEGLWCLELKVRDEHLIILERYLGCHIEVALPAFARGLLAFTETYLRQLETLFPLIGGSDTFRRWQTELPSDRTYLVGLAGEPGPPDKPVS